jgi:HAE1 family hydrophobic/amphiphilic exporter-1
MGVVLDELDASVRSFRGALIMAVILIYIVMAALFESFLLPLSILTTVPLAFLGVYWAMYVTGTSMDTVALIGAILMCGVIVNNGIVIVDHINQLRRHQGLDRHEAIVQGGLNRLRPVLMTALTTILGCVPIAIGTGSGQDVLNSLGRALVGGLTMGTVLTLFVVPMVYSIIDDFQVYMINFLGDVGSIVPCRAAKTDV